MENPIVVTTDIYLASYLVLTGGQIMDVEIFPVGKDLSCKLTLTGIRIAEAQEEFIAKKACINLYLFRSAYLQIQCQVRDAKQHFMARKELERKAELERKRAAGQI